MKTAFFFNFSDEDFIGEWNGKKRKFAAGSKRLMEAWMAEHFATHLANRELIKQGEFTSTSPKKPDQVPKFKVLFDKACIIDEDSEEEDEDDLNMDILNHPSNDRSAADEGDELLRGTGVQLIKGDVEDDADDDDFQGQ